MMTGALSVVEPGSPVQMVVAILVMMGYMLLVLKLAPFDADVDDWMSFVTSLALVLTTLGGLVLIQDKEDIFDADAVGTGIIVLNSAVLLLEVSSIVFVECKAVSRGKAAVRQLSHTQQQSKKKNKNQSPRGGGKAVSLSVVLSDGTTGQHAATHILPATGLGGEQQRRPPPPPPGPPNLEVQVDTIERGLHATFKADERRLAAETESKRRMQHSRVDARIAARRKLRQSKVLRKVDVFSDLPEDSMAAIIESMQIEHVAAGETIVRQGTLSDKFFVIVHGSCTVWLKTLTNLHGSEVARLSELNFFGESMIPQALRPAGSGGDEDDQPPAVRSATVSALPDTPVDLMTLTLQTLKRLLDTGRIDESAMRRVKSHRSRHKAQVNILRRASRLALQKGEREGVVGGEGIKRERS